MCECGGWWGAGRVYGECVGWMQVCWGCVGDVGVCAWVSSGGVTCMRLNIEVGGVSECVVGE